LRERGRERLVAIERRVQYGTAKEGKGKEGGRRNEGGGRREEAGGRRQEEGGGAKSEGGVETQSKLHQIKP